MVSERISLLQESLREFAAKYPSCDVIIKEHMEVYLTKQLLSSFFPFSNHVVFYLPSKNHVISEAW